MQRKGVTESSFEITGYLNIKIWKKAEPVESESTISS